MTPPVPTRRSELTGLRVVVSPQSPKDVALISPMEGERVLVLRKGQTQENATDRLLERFPREHVDDVRRFVSKHLPDAPSFESLLGAAPPPEWIAPPVSPTPPKVKVTRTTKLICTAAAAVICTTTLVGYSIVRDMTDSILEKPEFMSLSKAAGLTCTVLDQNSAECRNARLGTSWRVTATEADDPSEPNQYRFVSGDKIAVIQVFASEAARADYPVNAAYARLWPFRTSRARVSIGATDAPVVLALAGAADAAILAPTQPTAGIRPTPRATTPAQRPTTNGWLAGRPVEDDPSEPADPWPTDAPTGMLAVPVTPQSAPAPTSQPEPSSEVSTGTPTPPAAPDEPVGDSPTQPPKSGPPTTAGGGSQGKGAVVQLPLVTLSVDLGI